MLKLKLLGTPAIQAASGPVTGRAAQGRRLALLAVLALARGRSITRDKALALLWPESPTDRARHQLSDTLYILRAGLGEGIVHSVGDDLLLDPDRVEVDAAAFERLLDEGHLESAVEGFAGPLLDGFDASDTPEFERWLDTERSRLDHRYTAALERLARACDESGEFAAAAGLWRRLAAHDPCGGRVALQLMRSLEAAGDRAGALRQARLHAALLREEFDAEPDPEIVAFAERLRLEPAARAAPEPGPPQPLPRPDPVEAGARPAPPTAEAEGVDGNLSPAVRAHEASAAGPVAVRPARRFRALGVGSALLTLSIIGYALSRDLAVAPPAARSVAVLPFVDMSPESQDAYFGDGLSEEIIAALSRIEGVSVAARTSSFALRDRRLDVRAIGDTLGVAAVLEGSVRRQGSRLRVTAQLIDAATGYHIWSDEYDRQMEDIFAVQAEIAGAISGALEARLRGGERPPRGRHRPGLEAYDLYLRGLYLRNTLSADGLRQAADYFDRAIDLEPGFALAHAAKASVIAPLMYFGHVPLETGVAELRDLTGRALELDADLGEAYASLGILNLFFEWDWESAEHALRRAIELNPSDPHAFHHLANYLGAMRRDDEAVAARERAVELDPLNARTRITLGSDYFSVGDHERAIAEFRRAAQLDPVNPLTLGLGPAPPLGLVTVYRSEGRLEEAVQELIRIAVLRDASPGELQSIRTAWDESGIAAVWRVWLDMDLRQSAAPPDALRIASLLALAGDTLQAFDWLERAHRERNPGLIYLMREPAFEGVRSHPRVVRIQRAMRLPDG